MLLTLPALTKHLSCLTLISVNMLQAKVSHLAAVPWHLRNFKKRSPSNWAFLHACWPRNNQVDTIFWYPLIFMFLFFLQAESSWSSCAGKCCSLIFKHDTAMTAWHRSFLRGIWHIRFIKKSAYRNWRTWYKTHSVHLDNSCGSSCRFVGVRISGKPQRLLTVHGKNLREWAGTDLAAAYAAYDNSECIGFDSFKTRFECKLFILQSCGCSWFLVVSTSQMPLHEMTWNQTHVRQTGSFALSTCLCWRSCVFWQLEWSCRQSRG